MEKIKNILVATDLSVTARNAYRYAKAFAAQLDAALTVVHVKEQILIASDVVIGPRQVEDPQLLKDLEEFVAEEDATTGTFTGQTEVKIKIYAGNAQNVLVDLSKNKEIDLIIIGSTGLSDVLSKVFGSVSQTVSNQAECPVLLVPRGVKWQPIEAVLFASDYDSMTKSNSQHILDFAINIKAGIHFVNVRNYDPIFEAKQKDIDWDQLVEMPNSDLSFEKHTIYGNNTAEELNKYSEENKIDLMAFVSKHRHFWQNLVHTSTTENTTLSSTLPILVMHLDD